MAERNVKHDPRTQVVRSFDFAREILRSGQVVQDGAGAEHVDIGNPEHVPVFFLDGEIHKRRRTAIKKFFTPQAVKTRHQPIMERTTDALLARLRAAGSGRLDELAFELAVSVVSEIVGLTDSDQTERAHRIAHFLELTSKRSTGLRGIINKGQVAFYGYRFFAKDVKPALRVRRQTPKDDVLTQTIEKGYSDRAIMIECLTYATAGMVTTREFIVMVAWYMFERPELRERFLASDEEGQLLIIQEILRIEPVAAGVYRRATADLETRSAGKIPAGSRYSIDLRAVNSDELVVGECPFAIDPDRAKKQNDNGTFMSFGDGAHRCPGWQVALHETRVFIDRLLRVPGIRLVREPDMDWNPMVSGYELRNAVVVCDPA